METSVLHFPGCIDQAGSGSARDRRLIWFLSRTPSQVHPHYLPVTGKILASYGQPSPSKPPQKPLTPTSSPIRRPQLAPLLPVTGRSHAQTAPPYQQRAVPPSKRILLPKQYASPPPSRRELTKSSKKNITVIISEFFFPYFCRDIGEVTRGLAQDGIIVVISACQLSGNAVRPPPSTDSRYSC